MTDLLSEDELAGLKALRELAETLPPYDWQWTTLTGENGPYQSHEDMIEGIAKTIRHSESLGLHAITWNDEDVDGRSSVVCTTGNGPTSPLHAQYIAAVKPSNILRLLSHIDALKAERWEPIETAPKDGTPIIAYCVHTNAKYATNSIQEGWEYPVIAKWIDHNGGGWTWHGMAGTFTHWRPLPAPPSSQLQR